MDGSLASGDASSFARLSFAKATDACVGGAASGEVPDSRGLSWEALLVLPMMLLLECEEACSALEIASASKRAFAVPLFERLPQLGDAAQSI